MMRVFLIEDNPGDVRLIRELFREIPGASLEGATESLETAISLLAEKSVDAVLVDLNLPDSSGLETLTRLQTRFPQLPIIVFTGLDAELGIRAVHLGAQDFLVKGQVDSRLLQRVLLYAIERKQTQDELRRLNQDLERRVTQRTAELAAANAELEAFSYSVSHDLRSPLRSINGFSQALLEDYTDRLDETGRDYLNRVRAATQRMGHLIDDLLNLSRVTRSEINWEVVDLSTLGYDTIKELNEKEPARDVIISIAPDMTATGDKRLLAVLLHNLLENAWKFTGRQTDARIVFGNTIVNSQRAYYIRDNGAGFDMKYAHKLFNPFQRLHNVAEFPGTGIGLAIALRVVSRHSGRIWAEAKPSKGATFFFTLGTEKGGHDVGQDNSAG